MAFGGVATGSMNAKDVATVTGSIRYNGLTRMLTACVQTWIRRVKKTYYFKRDSIALNNDFLVSLLLH